MQQPVETEYDMLRGFGVLVFPTIKICCRPFLFDICFSGSRATVNYTLLLLPRVDETSVVNEDSSCLPESDSESSEVPLEVWLLVLGGSFLSLDFLRWFFF